MNAADQILARERLGELQKLLEESMSGKRPESYLTILKREITQLEDELRRVEPLQSDRTITSDCESN